MTLPGWDSPSTVSEIHQVLELAAIIFFAALVVLDVIAHLETPRHKLYERIGLVCFGVAVLLEFAAYPYGKRNDELSTHEIARLNKEAANARRETAELEARFAPRRIDKAQRARLIAILRTVPRAPVTVTAVVGDPESQQYAFDFLTVLKEAGWNPNGIDGLAYTAPAPTGVLIKTLPLSSSDAASELQRAFESVGIQTPIRDARFSGGVMVVALAQASTRGNILPANVIEIGVCFKPLPQ